VPLVEAMLADLIKTSETCRDLRHDLEKVQMENEVLRHENAFLQRDKDRCAAESTALHQKLVAEISAFKDREATCELAMRALDDQNKNLRFINTQLCLQQKQCEQELEAYKEKLDELLQRSLITTEIGLFGDDLSEAYFAAAPTHRRVSLTQRQQSITTHRPGQASHRPTSAAPARNYRFGGPQEYSFSTTTPSTGSRSRSSATPQTVPSRTPPSRDSLRPPPFDGGAEPAVGATATTTEGSVPIEVTSAPTEDGMPGGSMEMSSFAAPAASATTKPMRGTRSRSD